MAGGINTFGYVGGDPLSYIDYYGLQISYWSGKEIEPSPELVKALAFTAGAVAVTWATAGVLGPEAAIVLDAYLLASTDSSPLLICPVSKGITTQNGLGITGFKGHGVDRAIGNEFDRAGVPPQGILDAVKNPLKIGDVKVDQLGRPSQRFTGATGEVVVNPQSGKIVSVNPTSTKKRVRLMRQKKSSQ